MFSLCWACKFSHGCFFSLPCMIEVSGPPEGGWGCILILE